MPLMTARCIAPPITPQNLRDWPALARAMPEPYRSVMNRLLSIVELHRSGVLGSLPDKSQRDAWGLMFEALAEPQRTPAFHLLWSVNELSLGRSPRFE